MSAAPVLDEVVAWVVALDPAHNAKAALTARVERAGGKVVTRLGREVSHIIWERRHSRRPSDKAADEAELLELFRKLDKMDYPPAVVSPLWVEESLKAGRRLVERKYLVKKPTESLLGRTPGSASAAAAAAAAKKRKRPAAAVLPKPAEAYDLNELVFSSTQQMHNDLAGPAGVADDLSSPRGGGGKAQRRGSAAGGRQAQQQQRRGGSSAGRRGAMPTLAEEEAEEAGQQQQQRAVGVGTETQAVANILTIDLPDDEHCGGGGTPGGVACGADEEEQDELDTPLAMRFVKSSAERGWKPGGSGGRASGGAGAAAAGFCADKRSRLALVSGPRQEQLQDEQAEAAAPQDEAEQALEGEQQQQQEEQPAADQQKKQEEEELVAELEGDEQQQAGRAAAAAAARGVAARFSVRQLVQHPERPVLLHTGTPLPGSAPSSPADSKPADPIPVPVIQRVTSPWALAEQVPATQSQSQASQPAAAVEGGAAAAAAAASGRTSLGQPKAAAAGRRSLLAVSNIRRGSLGSGGAGAAAGGASGATPSSVAQPMGKEGGLPSPWSQLRPWDGKAAAAAAAAAPPAGLVGDENQPGPCQLQQEKAPAEDGQHPQQQQQQQQAGAQQQPETSPAAAAAAPGGNAEASPAGGLEAAAGSGEPPGPSQGSIALTSVDGGLVDLARSASRRLRGLRLCPEGREEGAVTHLVCGDERRTLKLMLAVANGAWLLSPQWITASLEAGRWLPESRFPAKVRFEAAAERARSQLEDPDALPLLHDHSIYIHLPDRARKLMGANAAALKRVAGVLGGKVVSPKSCTLCVVVGGGSRPPLLPRQAKCVKEEWLLQAAERFEQPPMEEFAIK